MDWAQEKGTGKRKRTGTTKGNIHEDIREKCKEQEVQMERWGKWPRTMISGESFVLTISDSKRPRRLVTNCTKARMHMLLLFSQIKWA